MIHAQKLNNAKPIVKDVSIKVSRDQTVNSYYLDLICEEVKKADSQGYSYANIMGIRKKFFTNVTLQIIALYGYKVEFYSDSDYDMIYIKWNKL